MDGKKLFMHRTDWRPKPYEWSKNSLKSYPQFHPLPTNPTRVPVYGESRDVPEKNVQSFQNLFSPGIPFWQRLLKFVALAGCLGLCVYQLYDRGALYFSEPTSVDVIITRNDTITFPSITFCSGITDFTNAIKYDMNKLTNETFTDSQLKNIRFEDHGLDLEKLWDENAINGSAFVVKMKTRRSTSYYGVKELLPGKMRTIDTAYCKCLTFTPDKLLELKGRTYVDISMDERYILPRTDILKTSTELYYYFHDAGASQKHESMGYDDVIPVNQRSTVILRIQKFSYKNKKRFHCQDELAAHAEQTKCIDDALKKAKINCRYPFIRTRTDLRPCATLNEVRDAIHRVYQVYDEPDVIKCHKKKQICRETVYSYPTPIMKKTSFSDMTLKLTITIPDNTFQTVNESFTYSFAALLSDIGGSLGFFLGLSVMTLFNVLHDVIRKFSRLFK